MFFRFRANEWAPIGAPQCIKLYRILYCKTKEEEESCVLKYRHGCTTFIDP